MKFEKLFRFTNTSVIDGKEYYESFYFQVLDWSFNGHYYQTVDIEIFADIQNFEKADREEKTVVKFEFPLIPDSVNDAVNYLRSNGLSNG